MFYSNIIGQIKELGFNVSEEGKIGEFFIPIQSVPEKDNIIKMFKILTFDYEILLGNFFNDSIIVTSDYISAYVYKDKVYGYNSVFNPMPIEDFVDLVIKNWDKDCDDGMHLNKIRIKVHGILHEKLKQMIINNIIEWNAEDIYAISLFVKNINDNPCRPTVTLSYNTETQVCKEANNASDEREARWNYAFWLQNDCFCFGQGETEEDVKEWYEVKQLAYIDDDNLVWKSPRGCYYKKLVKSVFIRELIRIVKEIHQEKVLTRKYGEEIPIIIHELEYYSEIAKQNIEANGLEGIENFVEYCNDR